MTAPRGGCPRDLRPPHRRRKVAVLSDGLEDVVTADEGQLGRQQQQDGAGQDHRQAHLRPPVAHGHLGQQGAVGVDLAGGDRLDRHRGEHGHGDQHAAHQQRAGGADDLAPGLAHRRGELAQRLQARIGQPGAGKAGEHLGPAEHAQAAHVAEQLRPGGRRQRLHDRPEQPGVHRHRRQGDDQRHARHQAGPAPAQRAHQQDRHHRRDEAPIGPERIDRGQVAHGRDRADGDGEQVGADHERPREHAHPRAEGLDRRRDAAASGRIAVRHLEVLERDEDEGDGGGEDEGRRYPAHLPVQDSWHVIDRRAEIGEHDRPGQPGSEAPDALAPHLSGVGEIDCNGGTTGGSARVGGHGAPKMPQVAGCSNPAPEPRGRRRLSDGWMAGPDRLGVAPGGGPC